MSVGYVGHSRGYVYNPITLAWEAMVQPEAEVSVPLTAAAPATASTSAVDATVVAANSARRGLVIVNSHSTANVSIGIGTAAIAGRGIYLAPSGVWEMDPFTFSTGAIHAISDVAGTVSIQEWS